MSPTNSLLDRLCMRWTEIHSFIHLLIIIILDSITGAGPMDILVIAYIVPVGYTQRIRAVCQCQLYKILWLWGAYETQWIFCALS